MISGKDIETDKQTKGHELKVVYTGQDLSMYDELKKGFEHLYLQPCYNEALDAGANGQTFHSTWIWNRIST